VNIKIIAIRVMKWAVSGKYSAISIIFSTDGKASVKIGERKQDRPQKTVAILQGLALSPILKITQGETGIDENRAVSAILFYDYLPVI
jgi:hypothetical protein